MKPGDLVKVRPGYRSFNISPYGVIIDETPDVRASVKITLLDGVYRMMAYEFEIIGPEKSGKTTTITRKETIRCVTIRSVQWVSRSI